MAQDMIAFVTGAVNMLSSMQTAKVPNDRKNMRFQANIPVALNF